MAIADGPIATTKWQDKTEYGHIDLYFKEADASISWSEVPYEPPAPEVEIVTVFVEV